MRLGRSTTFFTSVFIATVNLILAREKQPRIFAKKPFLGFGKLFLLFLKGKAVRFRLTYLELLTI